MQFAGMQRCFSFVVYITVVKTGLLYATQIAFDEASLAGWIIQQRQLENEINISYFIHIESYW